MEENTENPSNVSPAQEANKSISFTRKLIIAALIIVVFIGIRSIGKPQNQEAPTPEVAGVSATPTPEAAVDSKDKQITLEEIALHDQKSDCWFAIEDKVYDVTEFIASGKHPGKEAIIQGCGKDATELFNTRPMGSKTPHSETAKGFAESFRIGILAK